VRETRTICDVCREPILADASTLTAQCGPALDRFPSGIDLCASCLDRLTAFVRSGRPELPPDIDPPDDWPPRVGRSATAGELGRSTTRQLRT
jgi:hypothetical protein